MTTINVLIVDDNAVVRQAIAGLVRELGFDVTEANSAEAAQVPLEAGDFDVLLCDDSLGVGVSGTDFINGNAATMPLTVILMSGNLRPAGLSPAIRYLGKPFTIDQLEAALRPSPA